MSKPVILCVDDEKLILTSLRDQLQHKFGNQYQIELAESAEEALELTDELLESNVEMPLVIVDYVMPGMYGDELLVQLKEKIPNTLNIMLTGQATAEAVGEAVNKASLFRYIAKPWHETDFLLTVESALESYAQKQEIIRQQHYRHMLSKVIALALQPGELTQQLSLALQDLISVPELNQASAAIYLLNSDKKQLRLHCQIDQANTEFPSYRPAPSRTNGGSIEIENNLLETPLSYQSNLLGMIYVSHADTIKLHSRVLELLNAYADAVAGILSLKQYQYKLEKHNAELEGVVKRRTEALQSALKKQSELNDILLDANSKLDYFASMDGLTSLYNRRFFMKLANSELERARRYNHSTTFMMLDLDHFKSINDRYGHMAGDHVLEQVAEILKEESREVDLIGRLGGEEFAIVSPESNLDQASQLAERIRKKLNNTEITFNGNTISITASIGITEIIEKDNQIDAAMSRADYALYRSKDTGRNIVSVIEDPSETK